MSNNCVIQGLWVGSRLPTLQQLSISSFIKHGHEFHLYTYSPLQGVPANTVVRDASEILPKDKIFKNSNLDTFAAFSDFFRWKLLLDRGGWWADVDMVCLRPFDFSSEYVFSSEHNLSREVINCGVIKTPRGSSLMRELWETCQGKDRQALAWDEVGPVLLDNAIKETSLKEYVLPAVAFCPLPAILWRSMLVPEAQFHFGPTTYAVHLWNEHWRQEGVDVDAEYDKGCFYEQLKSMYLRNEGIDPGYNVFKVD
jgi:hypothetical protein